MAYLLGDVFIGDFAVTQSFGARPEVYSARYGMKGHNGTDFGCPVNTPLLSTADGFVSFIGSEQYGTFDATGFGNYLTITHPGGYASLYAHLNSIQVQKGDRVVSGQLIGHSGNTGFVDGAHLHFGVKPVDAQGNKTEAQNGFSGYIDPMSSPCEWKVLGLKAPVNPTANASETEIAVPSSDFVRMVNQGTAVKLIITTLSQHGLPEYLSSHGLPQIDVNASVFDQGAGQHVSSFLTDTFAQVGILQEALKHAQNSNNLGQTISGGVVDQAISGLSDAQRKNFLAAIGSDIKNFIFESK